MAAAFSRIDGYRSLLNGIHGMAVEAEGEQKEDDDTMWILFSAISRCMHRIRKSSGRIWRLLPTSGTKYSYRLFKNVYARLELYYDLCTCRDTLCRIAETTHIQMQLHYNVSRLSNPYTAPPGHRQASPSLPTLEDSSLDVTRGRM